MNEIENEDKKNDRNVVTESFLIGSIYKQPDFYIEYSRYIVSKYDFADDATRFFYDNFALMYETFTQTINEININAWMTQDKDRLKKYKLYGGYTLLKTWMDLSQEKDFKNYFSTVKKFSLIREYQRYGFPAERITEYSNFEKMTAKDVYKLIRSKCDKIFTIIDGEEESHIINDDMIKVINSCLITPDIGLPYPFEIVNELFKGMMEQTFLCVGMASNEGKTRFMIMLVAYISLVLKQKTFVMLNEMTERQIKHCLITTVLNNKEFKTLHGVDITKNEKEISLGLYRDSKGNFITRKTDSNGKFTETESDYIRRLEETSDEYNKVRKVAEWVEAESEGKIYVKELMRYDDATLEFEIRKHVLIYNVKYVFYDTMKNDDSTIGDWAAFKLTTTKLKQIINELKIYGYGSIQLTDDTHFTDPLQLNSNNIGACKAIKHLLDQLLLSRKISKESYYKYQIIQTDDEWGEPHPADLDLNKIYYSFLVDKNRKGDKQAIAFQVDLNLNTWQEVGILTYKKKKND